MIVDLMRDVDRLTITTKTVVSKSPLVVVDAPPLLGQLRAAVKPSGEKSSGGSGGAVSGTPLDLSALELMTQIQDEVNRAYWLVKDASRRPGIGGYTLEERLRFVAARVAESYDRPEGPAFIPAPRPDILEDVHSWVEKIDHLFDPVKVVPLPDHACPVCRATRVAVTLDTGEPGEAPALTVRFGTPLVASCGGCETRWPGAQMLDLAAVLGGNTQVMAHVLGSGNDNGVT